MYIFQNGGITRRKPAPVSQCVEYGKCPEKCPQHHPIPDLFKDVADDMEGVLTRPLIWLVRRMMKVRRRDRRLLYT